MFYQLQSSVEIILLLIGLVTFMAIAYRRLALGAALVLFLAPIYLLKIKIGWLPMNVLEILVWVLAVVWGLKKIYASCHPGLEPGSRFFEVWILAFARMTKKKFIMVKRHIFFWPILLIFIGVILSVIFSADLKTSAGIFKGYFIAPLIFAIILFDVVKTKEQLMKIIWALVLSGTAVAIIGLLCRLTGHLTFDGRLAAFYSSPNQLAMFLAPGFILAAGLWFYAQKKQLKWLLAISYMLYAFCLYFTYSYTVWLAISGAAIFMATFLWRRKIINHKKILVMFCLLAIIFMLFLVLQWPSQKMADLLNFERSSIQSRLMVWSAAQEILKDNWLWGIGPGMFQEQYLAYQNHFTVPYLEWAVPQPHNLWLAWWLEAGIIGLIGFVWLVANFFRRAFFSHVIKQPARLASQPASQTGRGGQGESVAGRPLVLMLMAVIIYILLHGLADTTIWRNDLALVFWSIIVLGSKAGHLFYSQKISNPL